MGAVLTFMLVWIVLRPVLDHLSLTTSYGDNSPVEFARAYGLRFIIPVLLYSAGGFAVTAVIQSTRRAFWLAFTVIIGTFLSLIFYGENLSGRIPHSILLERWLPIIVPLFGLFIGVLVGLYATRRATSIG